jgi:hypothetical protein
MNLRSAKLIGLVCLQLFSCNESKNKSILNKKTKNFSSFPIEKNIFFENIFKYNKGNVSNLKIKDSTLIIRNFGKGIEYYFYNYSLKTNKLSNGYLSKGRGPNEALGIACFGIKDNIFWTYDVTLKKFLLTETSKILKSDSIIPNFKRINFKKGFYEVNLFDENSYYGVGSSENFNSKITKMNMTNDKAINEYGSFTETNKPIDLLKDIYTSYIYMRPKGDKIVLPYRYTDVIEIFDIKNEKNFAIQGPENFDVIYEEGNRNKINYMKKTKETKKAFVSGAVTNDYIYLLYSGNNREDKNWSYGKQVYVYDWDGNPIQKINLDRYVYAICITSDNKTIYSSDLKTGQIVKASI